MTRTERCPNCNRKLSYNEKRMRVCHGCNHRLSDFVTIAQLMGSEFWWEETMLQADPLKVDQPGYLEKLDAHMRARGYGREP